VKKPITKHETRSQGTRRNLRLRTLLSILVLTLSFSASAVPALAQGCAMCYQTVKGAPKDGQRAIGRGILILLIPPLGAMTLGVAFAFRYGKQRDRENESVPSDQKE
jgi:hypothetical protein